MGRPLRIFMLSDDAPQQVAVFHLELEDRDVPLANGAPAESYSDDGNRHCCLDSKTCDSGVRPRVVRRI
jgi:hypothetical protein